MVMQIEDIVSVKLKHKDGKTKLQLFDEMPELWSLLKNHKGSIEILRKQFLDKLSPKLLTLDDWHTYFSYTHNKICVKKSVGKDYEAFFFEKEQKYLFLLNQIPTVQLKGFDDNEISIESK